MKIRILASGPSMSQALADSFRGLNVLTVNDTYKLAPWATGLCAQDLRWWAAHPDAMQFAGRKFSSSRLHGVEWVKHPHLDTTCSSGVLAVVVALQLGATEIELHGFDHGGLHYFGSHPAPLKNTNDTPERWAIFAEQFARVGIDCAREGVRIINKTPGSALDCFERG